MSRTLQINPTSPVFHVSPKFTEFLLFHAEEFALKYYYLDPENEEMMEALREFVPQEPEEAEAIRQIMELIEREEEVELLYGY